MMIGGKTGNQTGDHSKRSASKKFHTPSFGDEEFDIPPFGLQGQHQSSFSGPVSQAHQTLYSHTQPLSHPLSPNNGATRPLTHHPRTAPGYSPPGQNQHLYTNPGGQGPPPPVTNGQHNGVHSNHEEFVIPKFPPQNIDIPDITGSHSPYNHSRSSPQQQQQHQQHTYHGQFTGVIYSPGYHHQQQQQQQQNQQQQNQQYGLNQTNNNLPGQQNQGQQNQQQNQQQQQQREPILTTLGQQHQQGNGDPQQPQQHQQQVATNGHHPQHPQQHQHQQQQKPGMEGRQSSPSGSTHTSPGRESSEDSDDSLPLAQLAMKRTAPESPPQTNLNNAVVVNTNTTTTANGASASKKPKTPKKRKKKDPNEPHKPVSAYALFFRDTQAAIKGQNPNASFGEVSKIVASMWDNLDADQKAEYKKKTETAKKEYLKQLAAYRASLVSKQPPGMETMDHGAPGATAAAMMQAQQKGMMSAGMPPNMPNMMPPNMSPNNMPSPPSHMSPPQLTHLPDGTPHMMPQGMPGGMPHQMGMSGPPHQQPSMTPGMPGHRPQGMGSPQGGPMGSPMHMNNQGHQYAMDGRQMRSPSMCIRNGCQNHAISNPAWDNEYCSNACVVSHCRDVFTAWVAARQTTNSYASVK